MEIVFRAAFIFIFLWIVTRAVGRAQLGELSTFQLLLYVTIGDLVQQGITQQDYSVTGSLLAVSTFALLTIVISWLAWRYKRLRPMIDGMPIIVMRDGDPVIDAMAQGDRRQGVLFHPERRGRRRAGTPAGWRLTL